MSSPGTPDKAKLVIGLLTADKKLAEKVAPLILEAFGQFDLISRWMAFDYTTYYKKEMGWPLFRRLFSMDGFVDQKSLPDIKLMTNDIEKQFSENGNRKVNIDPGMMLPSRFVLATGKDFAHRVYLDKGIYADLTLLYSKSEGYTLLPWTYPDYAEKKVADFLLAVRKKYRYNLAHPGSGTRTD